MNLSALLTTRTFFARQSTVALWKYPVLLYQVYGNTPKLQQHAVAVRTCVDQSMRSSRSRTDSVATAVAVPPPNVRDISLSHYCSSNNHNFTPLPSPPCHVFDPPHLNSFAACRHHHRRQPPPHHCLKRTPPFPLPLPRTPPCPTISYPLPPRIRPTPSKPLPSRPARERDDGWRPTRRLREV